MEGDGAVEQRDHRLEADRVVQAAGVQAQPQGACERGDAFDVAANREQAPAAVAHHAVGLGARDGREQFARALQRGQCLGGAVFGVGRQGGAVARKSGFGALDQVPVFGRQAFAHLRGGRLERAQVEAHAVALAVERRTGRGREGGHERAGEHAGRLLGRWHVGQHQGVLLCGGRQPGQQRLRGGLFAAQVVEHDLREAHRVFGAFGVAAEPEQVFCRAAGDGAFLVRQRQGAGRVLQQAGVVHRAVGEHPAVGAAATALHAGHELPARRQPHQATGQHAPALRAVGQGEHAQHGGARRDGPEPGGCRVGRGGVIVPGRCGRRAAPLARPGGRLAQGQPGLHGVVVRVTGHAARPFVQLTRAQALAHCGFQARARVGGLDHAVFEQGQHLAQRGVFAAPPGGQRGQGEFFAQQVAADGGQKTQQRTRLQGGRARRVGQQQVAGAQHLQQAGHAQGRVGAHLQRVQPFVVHAFDERVHRLQAAEGLEVQALVAHRQVVALDQREAQVARQIGVFEIGFVVGAGREQRDTGVLALGRQGFEAVHQRAVAGGQALHFHAGKSLGELARDGNAVFQQVTQAGRRLRALAHHPPAAVGAVGQIEGDDVQPGVTRRANTLHGTQVTGVALHQRSRQQGLFQQFLRAVQVGHHGVEQARALQHAGFDLCPVFGRHDGGEQVQRPGALQAFGAVGVDVVGDAVVADLPLQVVGAAVEVGQSLGAHVLEELRPVWRQGVRVVRIAQLVAVAGVGRHRERQRPVARRFGAERVEQGVSEVFWDHGFGVCPGSGLIGRRGSAVLVVTRGVLHVRVFWSAAPGPKRLRQGQRGTGCAGPPLAPPCMRGAGAINAGDPA